MLKVYCFLLGENYKMVSIDTPKSKQKIVLLGNAILIPIIVWITIGYLLSYKTLGASRLNSILISCVCGFLILLIERLIILSSRSIGMAFFRIILGSVVAVIGAISLDEIIMKDDVDEQLNINKEQKVDAAKYDAAKAFDNLYEISAFKNEISRAEKAYDSAQRDLKNEEQGKGSKNPGVGDIAKALQVVVRERLVEWNQSKYNHDSILQLKERYIENAAKKTSAEYKSGVLLKAKALFQMIRTDSFIAFVYVIFTILMFCLEFIVIFVKIISPETNYELKMQMIENIGRRRLTILQQEGSPLVDPGHVLPNGSLARKEINKKNQSIFS